MTARRFPHAPLPDAGGELALALDVAQHLRVLRLDVGSSFVLFDGEGGEADATLTRVGGNDGDDVMVRVGPRRVVPPEPPLRLLLALPKGAKLEAALRMATELGVTEVRLVAAAHCVSRWDAARAAKRVARLEKIAREAARQSERATVPSIVAPMRLGEILASLPPGVRLACLARGDDEGLASLTDEDVTVAIGPEGGFSEDEVAELRAAGFSSLRLGPHVLRFETAVPVALGLIVAAR